ncbi:NAD(+) synthase [Dysgonomonadaceae bacterium zrk40]|nr:NAD(+) synthase [Dysgonomonadaceae bacterium zrk40]
MNVENAKKELTPDLLYIEDIERVCNEMALKLHDTVVHQLNRKGAVVGISGGIDSSTTLALSVKAFGAENVLGVILPETESSSDSELMARRLAARFGIEAVVEHITDALRGFGCYERRNQAIKKAIPEFNPLTDKSKIVINQSAERNIPPLFSVTVVSPNGEEKRKVLSRKDYLQIVASSNFKQRTRMSMLYYYAETLYYAVIDTPNKQEVEQGFFVKHGDGGADVMPLAHLYKTQVYQLAKHLGVPGEIIDRIPTTDTYSAEQTQEEFFFQMPYSMVDLITYGVENNYSVQEIAASVGKTEEETGNIIASLKRKRKTTAYLRSGPLYF